MFRDILVIMVLYIALFICTGSEPNNYKAANEKLEQEARDIETHAATIVSTISTEDEWTEYTFKTRKLNGKLSQVS